MASSSNSIVRLGVPLVMIAAGAVLMLVMTAGGGDNAPQDGDAPSGTPSSQTEGTPAGEQGSGQDAPDTGTPEQAEDGEIPTEGPARNAADEETTPEATGAPVKARPVDAGPFTPLGALRLTPAFLESLTDEELEVVAIRRGLRTTGREATTEALLALPDPEAHVFIEFSPYGAGFDSLRLSDSFDHVTRAHHTVVQETLSVDILLTNGRIRTETIVPFSVIGVYLDEAFVDLTGLRERCWRELEPGVFEATIEREGTPILRVERRVRIDETYSIHFDHTFESLDGAAHEVQLVTYGPAQLREESGGYGGDKRRVRFGYLLNDQADPSGQYPQAEEYLWPRRKAMGKRNKDLGDGSRPAFASEHRIWPNDTSTKRSHRLVWAAMTNRYFSCAILPTIEPSESAPDKILHVASSVDAIVLNRFADARVAKVAMRLTSDVVRIEPGASSMLEASIYAGPLARADIKANDTLAAVGLHDVVVYNFGGPCAPCTFTWLTYPLLALLRTLHGMLGDWAISIILMVVCVRTILHPVTRWSQIKMQRFGKQMQELGPKQKKLQERYKDDKKKMQEEMQKLWREEGMNPAGALGCLPMFLQTPVWIALYATLYFAIELRQQPAFYGIFQSFGDWTFLRDLAEPDALVSFGRPLFNFPLWGEVSSFNVLPIVLGFVFFAHQKFMSPPTSATLTPEQEQQQKIMKVMMVVMFPVFMYNAPSGMAIYFIANSTIAIFESKWIRSHAEKKGLLKVEDRRKKRKKPGRFMAKLQKMAEEQQRKQQLKNLGPRSQPKEPKEKPKQRTYKKR